MLKIYTNTLLWSVFFLSPAFSATLFAETNVRQYHYQIIEQFPHSREVFTQGLEYHNGLLYESAGRYRRSRLIQRKLEEITPIQQHRLPSQYFAEGISLFKDKLYQLTWRSGRVFIYHADNLSMTGHFSIDGEGWGLTNNGQQLIMSNGSDQLLFIDPQTFQTTASLSVSLNGKALSQLNELEWVDGLIYANIWQSDKIVMIDPISGHVLGQVDLSGLLPSHLKNANTNVLNGIAYDQQQQRLLVTGKYWPHIYHIDLYPVDPLPGAQP